MHYIEQNNFIQDEGSDNFNLANEFLDNITLLQEQIEEEEQQLRDLAQQYGSNYLFPV